MHALVHMLRSSTNLSLFPLCMWQIFMTFFGALFSQFSHVLNTFITFVILREVVLFVFLATHVHHWMILFDMVSPHLATNNSLPAQIASSEPSSLAVAVSSSSTPSVITTITSEEPTSSLSAALITDL